MPELPKKKGRHRLLLRRRTGRRNRDPPGGSKSAGATAPGDTVTICLPLFLAGGEGDRAFAKFYPTIAIDGCDKRCAARGTEMYSGKPAASIVVTDLVAERGLGKPEGKRRLNEAGKQAVEATAAQMAELVDDLLQKHWNRTAGAVEESRSAGRPGAGPGDLFLRFRYPGAGYPRQRADGHSDRPAAHLPAVASRPAKRPPQAASRNYWRP